MKLFYLTMCLFIGTFNTLAQPANNACASAVALTSGAGCVNGDNTGATTEGLSTPSCFGGNPSNYSASVWYSFMATDDSMTVNFGGGTLFGNTMSAVYTSCAGTTEVGCANGGSDVVLTTLIPGSTYYIMVDGTGNNVGTFCISVFDTPIPAPGIGECPNPRTLFVGSDCNNVQGAQYDEQNNFLNGGSSDAGLPMTGTSTVDAGCAGSDVGQNSYWVEVNSGSNTTLTFANAGGTALDYALYTGDCSSLTSVSCQTAAGGGSVSVAVTANTDYLVMITGGGANNPTQAYLCITGSNIYSPPNDDCPDATQISTLTNCFD